MTLQTHKEVHTQDKVTQFAAKYSEQKEQSCFCTIKSLNYQAPCIIRSQGYTKIVAIIHYFSTKQGQQFEFNDKTFNKINNLRSIKQYINVTKQENMIFVPTTQSPWRPPSIPFLPVKVKKIMIIGRSITFNVLNFFEHF